jgi:streptogramin lyase
MMSILRDLRLVSMDSEHNPPETNSVHGSLIAAAPWYRIVLIVLALSALPIQTQAGELGGSITDGGVPVGGGMVTARELSSGIEVTVFSAADGNYLLDRLAAGAYVIDAKVAGKKTVTAQQVIDEATRGRLDFQVQADPDFRTLLPSAQWFSLLPEGTMKLEFILNCTSCHEISHARIFRNGTPRTAEDWAQAIALMRSIDIYGLTPPDFNDADYAAWLAQHLNAEAIAGLQAARLASGAALAARITEYPVPVTPSLPHDLVLGPDGRVWITGFYNNVVWALDPADGAIQSFPVNEKPDVMGQVRALSFDRKGMLWVLLGGTESLVRLDPADGSIRTFALGMYPHSIEVDSRGKIWFNDYISSGERIGSIDPATGKLEVMNLPSAGLTKEQGLPLLYGLQIDSKDVLWGTLLAANKLFRYDTRSGETKLYDMPAMNSGPRRPGMAPDDSVWIPEFNTGKVARFDPVSETFTRYELGSSSFGPYDVAVDPVSGHVWSAGSLASAMVRIDPATGRRDTFPFPTEPAYPRHMAIDAETGDVWTTYSSMPDAKPKITHIEIRDRDRIIAKNR